MFLTRVSLLVPAFALLSAPTVLTVHLHCAENAPLPHADPEGPTHPKLRYQA
jgi:hypothetical protein